MEYPVVRLWIIPARGESFAHEFKGDELIIGRSSRSGLTISDDFLSRFHARLFWQDDSLNVEDSGSRNGTFLNQQVIRSPTSVQEGDEIKVSSSKVIIKRIGKGEKPSSMPEQTVFRDASDVLRQLQKPEAAMTSPLQILHEVHMALGRWMSRDELLDLIMDKVFEHLKPEEGILYLRHEDQFVPTATRSRYSEDLELIAPKSIVEEVAKKARAALVYDTETDQRFSGSESIVSRGIRCLIAAPLLGPEGSMGMIVLSSMARTRAFTEQDMALLVSLASIAALRIHSAHLAEQDARRQQLEKELQLARKIQVALMPSQLPAVSGFEFFAANFPSQGVSGDYYEVVSRKDGTEFIAMIADVSGKGISASLLTASLEALAAGPIEEGLAPHELCEKLSRLLYRRTPPERYASLFLLEIRPNENQIRYCNAGHLPGLIARDGGLDQIKVSGVPIGLLRASTYKPASLTLKQGETLLLYTDGFSEAENHSGEDYGIARLEQSYYSRIGLPLDEIAQAIDQDLKTFTGRKNFEDDRTLFLIRRVG